MRLHRMALLPVAAIAYAGRPWSCSVALGQFRPENAVAYADFDRHGFGTMLGFLMAVAFAPPFYWLALRIAAARRADLLAAEVGTRITIGSLLIAATIAAPTFAQLTYLRALPLEVVWPVIASCALWAVVVAFFWGAFIRSEAVNRLAHSLKFGAAVLAGIVTVPKVLVIAAWLT